MRTHYIISDTHLADRSKRDDFKRNYTKFKSFLQMVKKQKAQLIIAGDFLELWQASLIDIPRSYPHILNQLIAIQTKIIIGNHDYYLHHFRKLNFLYHSFQIPGTKIFIQHGHQFDHFNDSKGLMYLANLAAMAGGIMEDIHPDLDAKAFALLQRLNKKVGWILNPFWAPGTGRKEYLSQGGDFSEYLHGAKKLLTKYDYVIIGHTHRPGTAFAGRYLNAGSWTAAKPTYVQINRHGEPTLKYWPSQNPVRKVLAKK